MRNIHLLVVASSVVSFVSGCGGAPSEEDATTASQDLTLVCGAAPNSAVQGVDVSYYQGNFSWPSAHVEFGAARISDGVGYIDSTFEQNWAAMKANNVRRSAYQFFEPGENATAQANLVIAKVGRLGAGDLPVALDIEVTGGQSPATIRAAAQTWLDLVEAGTGKRPLIYSYASFLEDNLGTGFGAYPLWIAAYGVSCPYVPAGWSNWTAWQYSDGNGALDHDVWNGSLAQLDSFAGASGTRGFAAAADTYAFVGDWNGGGVKTPGFYDVHTHEWSLSGYDAATGVEYKFGWGGDGDVPVVGDWNGDGIDTPGLYNPVTHLWSLSNHLSSGGVDISFGWGGNGYLPIVGDWNGDGIDTPGLYDPTSHEWKLSNKNASGGVDYAFGWGGDGDIPVVGDWNGDGIDTPGTYNATTHEWKLSNHNSAGGVDYAFGWGGNGTLPVPGRWEKGATLDTPGLFNATTREWSLSNRNASGGVDFAFGWGGVSAYTVVGGPVL